MFGFIKFLQNFLQKLQQNKRAWFTLIFVISITGITLSITLLTLLTSRSTEAMYTAQAKEYNKRYTNFYNKQLSIFRKMSTMMLENETFMNLVSQNNIEEIATYVNDKNTALQDSGFVNTQIKYYGVESNELSNLISSVIQSRNTMYGISIMTDGVYYVYMNPVFIDDQVNGVLEIRSNLSEMHVNFLNIDQEFAFLLEKNLITQISLIHQENKYETFGQRYLFNKEIFPSGYIKELGELEQSELQKFFDNGYITVNNYYIAYDDVVDLNGATIGIVLYGERLDREGSMINIISNMTKQVVMIALGLIISVLLFMF